MAEIAQQPPGQHLDVPNINIQPASSGEEDTSSESDGDIPKPREKSEAEGESEDTGDDTSTWDSDPATPTPRSSRDYYPLKGSSEKIYPSQGGDYSIDNIPAAKAGYSVDLYLKTLSGHLGEGDSNKSENDENNLSGIPLSAARRVVDGGEEIETEQGYDKELNQDDDTNDENEEEEELKRLQDGEDDDEEEDIEELDLTKQQHQHFHQGGGVAPDAHVMFVPSLNTLGTNPISTLMSQLIGNQPSLFHSQDGSSTEDEDVNPQGVVYGKRFEGSEDGGSESQLHKWEELFQLLEIQHQQQLTLQSDQHERRMEHLRQLMTQQQIELQELQQFDSSPGGVNPPTNKQLQTQTHQYVPGQDDEEVTSPRNEYSSAQDHEQMTGHDKNNNSSDSDESDVSNHGNMHEQSEHTESATSPHIVTGEIQTQVVSNSSDMGTDKHKNLNQTRMTTWSDVKGQRSDAGSQRSRPTGERDIPTGHLPEDHVVSREVDATRRNKDKEEDGTVPRSYVEEMQSHYEKEKESLQKQYEDQLQALQRQWYQLQQQQQEQQQVLHHLLARQQERIEHQQRALKRQGEQVEEKDDDRTPTGTPDHQRERSDSDVTNSDVSSTTYSNFTYWRLKEEDTYKALPLSPGKEEDQKPTDEDKLGPSLRLKEKHARHVADLKAYYESEIHDLRAQLTQASSLKDYSPSKAMERTNERLQQNCTKLEAALKFANSRIQDLEKTITAVGARLREQPDKSASTANTISSLQQTTEDLKQLCRQKQAEVQELEKKNRQLQVSLEQAYQLQDVQAKEDKRDQRMLNRVMSEYKTLAQDHELAKAQLSATEMQLYDAKTEAVNLKRKVSHLEVEVKRLSHEMNKMQRKETILGSGSILSDPGTQMSFTRPLPLEERKYLKPTAGYNMFTGEEIANDTSSESLPQASDTESSQERSGKASRRLEENRPSNLTLQPGPFDSDLADRPLSPMMKAAAQFQRWKGEGDKQLGDGDQELSGVLREPKRIVMYSESSSQSDEDHDVTLQDVSTQTQNGVSAGRPSSDTHGDSRLSARQHTTAGLPSSVVSPEGGIPTGDSSIHIWPESEPRNRSKSPLSKPPERKPVTSPRQLARQSLAKYARTQPISQSPVGMSSQSRGQSSSPRRNLAFQFQEAAEQERGSPLGSSSMSERMESPRTGFGQPSISSTSSKYSSRRGLLEGREGLSSSSPPTRSVTHMPAEKESAVENALARVRAGDVLTRPDWQTGETVQKSRFSPRTPKNPEEIGHKIMQKLEEHEKRLDELIMEKRQLETALSHLPTSGRGSRQQQEKLEDELEKVTRELGSVRMLLRKYNALKTS